MYTEDSQNAHHDYWAKILSKPLPILTLPGERLGELNQSEWKEIDFNLFEVHQLNELSQEVEVPVPIILLTMFHVLIYRYTNQQDLLVGFPVSNKNSNTTQKSNTLILRTIIKDTTTFVDLCKHIYNNVVQAGLYQSLPSKTLIEEDLYKLTFVYQSQTQSISNVFLCSPGEQFDKKAIANFIFIENDESIRSKIIYKHPILDNDILINMIYNYQSLIRSIFSNPQQEISKIPLLSEQEYELIMSWNPNPSDFIYPKEKCLHELFEDQVDQTPDKTAVIFHKNEITYKELNEQSNKLASYLKSKGVGPDVLVGICLERSIELIVGIMGILKAGGAYVPIDPRYPQDRVTHIVKDTNTPLVLTSERCVNLFEGIDLDTICLDTELDHILSLDIPLPKKEVMPTNLAYVIYTSGTTGKPKGVAIEHHSPVALLHWALSIYPLDTLSGVLASTSICFDLSVFEIFLPLICGGKVVLVDNLFSLIDLPVANEVSLINTVPSVLAEYLRFNTIPHSVKVVNLAGEPLKSSLVRQIYQAESVEYVYNLYGPTEDTTYSTYELILRDSQNEPTIGKPIANTHIYILDKQLKPVPIGVEGELYIAGEGLARGYLNQPDLTDHKFIPNPVKDGPYTRVYKTGDLARFRVDGSIEYIGRIDDQVKVRGHRIELQEIETVLLKYPGIQQALVLVREDLTNHLKCLVAYIVLNKNLKQKKEILIKNIWSYLKNKLPDYMVPSYFEFIDHIPLTYNGKVDRNALPVLSAQHNNELSESIVGPRDDIEEKIVQFISEILPINCVGIYDSFFEIGGDSLSAVRLMARIRDYFEVELTLQMILEMRTIAELADFIKKSVPTKKSKSIIGEMNSHESSQMTISQKSLWLMDKLYGGSSQYNIVKAFRIKGDLDVKRIEYSLNRIIERHDALRTNFRNRGDGNPISVIHNKKELKIEVKDFSHWRDNQLDQQVTLFIQNESNYQFDLEKETLIRVTILKLAAHEYVMVFNLHHIIADGWSMILLIEELLGFYYGNIDDTKPPFQFSDYVILENKKLQDVSYKRQLQYWKAQLNNCPTYFSLPTDRPRETMRTFQGGCYHFTLPIKYKELIKIYSQREGVTPYMVLVSIFIALLYRYTMQNEIVVGMPISNRSSSYMEKSIGFFLNTLVLRVDASGYPTFNQLLKRVRKVMLEAFNNKDVTFEMLIDKLKIKRPTQFNPLFQVMFNFFKPPFKLVNNGELIIKEMKIEKTLAKYDMDFYLEETEEELKGYVEFNKDLFNKETIVQFVEHYQALLGAILIDDFKPIPQYFLSSATRQQKQKVEIKEVEDGSFTVFKSDEVEQSLVDRFCQQVNKYPEKIAVLTKSDCLTYKSLNELANGVAHKILGAGLEKQKIGLFFEQGVHMVVGLIGTLKAGSAYVPIDPFFPDKKILFMADDAELNAIVTNSRNLKRVSRLFSNSSKMIINIDECHIVDENPEIKIDPDELAYILYTSGSTGIPKGVMQSHRNVLHHIKNYTNSIKLSPNDRLIQLASYCFDAAVMDMFGALMNGATLYPLNVREESFTEIGEWIKKQKITVYHSTPTLFRYLLEYFNDEKFHDIRVVVLGGEAAHQKDVSLYKKHFTKDCFFVNGLGPTECTIGLQYVLDQETSLKSQYVPVGYPVEDVEVLLLDEKGNPTDLFGEIAFKSRYVALGYWNRLDESSKAFLNDSSKKIFRTGDLARLLPDGTLLYLGRKDFQFKVRGYKVDPSEIELSLLELPYIKDALVVVHSNKNDEPLVVAYVVHMNHISMPMQEIRNDLKAKLPEYMIPTRFEFVKTIPLTSNGKMDRHSLPRPTEHQEKAGGSIVEPQNETEEMILDIWKRVLGQLEFGVTDDFFELGGHSLQAIQMMTEINRAFQVKIPLHVLFEFPTISCLAEYIKTET
ncbi:non-ribosomal peptide synthetase [Paenactinomyces guangxiensis]|uniref:Amino acid adenylation domain-containing protein n=1 Tax=Paenactinomyces guangxiensis TaxID=1490290 RepID=A0A7W2A7T8_9BACL|nr:non-ribosomal peptide synthetase [Paenactinomyces guangxiensis]MBA4493457.1 amino acid adenylation domain-containing protein [Paenactinomyces guangxiensis]MBH8590548.1 amino acid adenylation domain-containing protein [Paenactinomyces guangxiensis]